MPEARLRPFQSRGRAPRAFRVRSTDLAHGMDALGCGVFGRTADGGLGYVNERLLSWTGYERAELLGQPMTILIPRELDQVCEAEVKCIEAGDLRARLTTLRRKDSSTVPVIVFPQFRRESPPDALHLAVVIDLGAIETAKPAHSPRTGGLRNQLERMGRELQVLGLLADVTVDRALGVDHPSLAELSSREREVLAQLLSGQRVATIARALHISPHTVRNHLKSMFRQLGVSSQSELIAHVRALHSALPPAHD